MSLDFLGKPKDEVVVAPYKAPAISPFDFINAIHYSKENLIVDDWSEKQYNAFIINKGLSYGADTVIPANEMNSRPHLDKKMQFSFLINNIRLAQRPIKYICRLCMLRFIWETVIMQKQIDGNFHASLQVFPNKP